MRWVSWPLALTLFTIRCLQPLHEDLFSRFLLFSDTYMYISVHAFFRSFPFKAPPTFLRFPWNGELNVTRIPASLDVLHLHFHWKYQAEILRQILQKSEHVCGNASCPDNFPPRTITFENLLSECFIRFSLHVKNLEEKMNFYIRRSKFLGLYSGPERFHIHFSAKCLLSKKKNTNSIESRNFQMRLSSLESRDHGNGVSMINV